MGNVGQTQLVHARNSKSTSREETGLGGTRVHTVDTRLKTQVLNLFQGDQGNSHIKGWNSDNLGKATFAVWIHTDSPINSALLDRFLCLSQHTMVPTSKGRQPWVCKDTSRSQIHSQALWAQAPFSPAPGLQEEQNTLDLGSEGAREVPESQDECRAYMKQHSASGSSDKRWHCLPSELDIFRCHQSKYI